MIILIKCNIKLINKKIIITIQNNKNKKSKLINIQLQNSLMINQLTTQIPQINLLELDPY